MVNTSPILISGATGREATRLLISRGLSVRALVHTRDERSERLAHLGADVVVGDLLDVRAVQRAWDGMKRGYFVYPMRPGLVQAAAYFLQGALDAGAEFIVNMSQRTAQANAQSDAALQHWLTERLFDRAWIGVAHLQPTIFHDWLLYMRGQIREGRYHVPFDPEGRFAPVASEDQACVIAAILADPGSHVGQTYQLTGPEELTAPDIARIATEALGHEVSYARISGEQWVGNLHGIKAPYLAQHLDGIAQIQAQGGMAGQNDTIERIAGIRPMSTAQFIEKHRAAFQ